MSGQETTVLDFFRNALLHYKFSGDRELQRAEKRLKAQSSEMVVS